MISSNSNEIILISMVNSKHGNKISPIASWLCMHSLKTLDYFVLVSSCKVLCKALLDYCQ